MNVRNSNDLTSRYYGNKAILAIYRGTKLIWEAVSSCFGSGLWLRDKTWRNDDMWRRS